MKSFQVLLSNDVETNPGPGIKCSSCEKVIRSNSKKQQCSVCKEMFHKKCTGIHNRKNSTIVSNYICTSCIYTILPFSKERTIDDSPPSSTTLVSQKELTTDSHLQQLNAQRHNLSIAHLNTQSITSSFTEFELMLSRYKFDIITLSETWLKDNQYLLQHVSIGGYRFEYVNRGSKRGGGVGLYIKETIKYKVRHDIHRIDQTIEHLWIEVSGKNKYSKVLLCVMYQSNFCDQERVAWIEKFDFVIGSALLNWSGDLVLTGDFNIDLLKDSTVRDRYMETLYSYGLLQHVRKPTRKGRKLIDHVLPTPEISDHDAVYICLNSRTERYQPRFKFIRDMKNFKIESFVEDISTAPFNLFMQRIMLMTAWIYSIKFLTIVLTDILLLRKSKLRDHHHHG